MCDFIIDCMFLSNNICIISFKVLYRDWNFYQSWSSNLSEKYSIQEVKLFFYYNILKPIILRFFKRHMFMPIYSYFIAKGIFFRLMLMEMGTSSSQNCGIICCTDPSVRCHSLSLWLTRFLTMLTWTAMDLSTCTIFIAWYVPSSSKSLTMRHLSFVWPWFLMVNILLTLLSMCHVSCVCVCVKWKFMYALKLLCFIYLFLQVFHQASFCIIKKWLLEIYLDKY